VFGLVDRAEHGRQGGLAMRTVLHSVTTLHDLEISVLVQQSGIYSNDVPAASVPALRLIARVSRGSERHDEREPRLKCHRATSIDDVAMISPSKGVSSVPTFQCVYSREVGGAKRRFGIAEAGEMVSARSHGRPCRCLGSPRTSAHILISSLSEAVCEMTVNDEAQAGGRR
jgi:hypothetical protein